MAPPDDSMLYPNRNEDSRSGTDPSRRQLLVGGATAGLAATAGCSGLNGGGGPEQAPTVIVFNTGDGTVSLIDPDTDAVVGRIEVGLSSSFPSNQYTPRLTTGVDDSLWLNVGRGIRALAAGSLAEQATIDTRSGANWLEQTPDGTRLIVSAREPSHQQLRIDAETASATFGTVTARLYRRAEGGRGEQEGPGPCDVTVHPDGEYAYVPDLFGDTLTVLRVDPFEIVRQIDVAPIGDGPASPWMATAAPDGETLLVEHSEGQAGTESIWDLSDPAAPTERARLTPDDGLGQQPLTSEIGPEGRRGYVFTPGSNDVTVIDLETASVSGRLSLGGAAFVGTWTPDRSKLYVPVQTADEVAVIDHARGEIVSRVGVGPSPYGATAARVRPTTDAGGLFSLGLTRLGLGRGEPDTTYCIGRCACGHRLEEPAGHGE